MYLWSLSNSETSELNKEYNTRISHLGHGNPFSFGFYVIQWGVGKTGKMDTLGIQEQTGGTLISSWCWVLSWRLPHRSAKKKWEVHSHWQMLQSLQQRFASGEYQGRKETKECTREVQFATRSKHTRMRRGDLRNFTFYLGPKDGFVAQELLPAGLQSCFISKTGLQVGMMKPKISNGLRSLVKNISSNTGQRIPFPILNISLQEENHRSNPAKAVTLNSRASGAYWWFLRLGGSAVM